MLSFSILWLDLKCCQTMFKHSKLFWNIENENFTIKSQLTTAQNDFLLQLQSNLDYPDLDYSDFSVQSELRSLCIIINIHAFHYPDPQLSRLFDYPDFLVQSQFRSMCIIINIHVFNYPDPWLSRLFFISPHKSWYSRFNCIMPVGSMTCLCYFIAVIRHISVDCQNKAYCSVTNFNNSYLRFFEKKDVQCCQPLLLMRRPSVMDQGSQSTKRTSKPVGIQAS